MKTRIAISPEEALDLVIRSSSPCPPQAFALADAGGLVLTEAMLADRDYPPFPRAMMDGFAVRVADAGRTVPVVGEIPAGCFWQTALSPDQCLEILTGAACPPGTEAVVKKEDINRLGDQIRLPAVIAAGQHIAPQGSECRAGQPVLAAGDVVTPLAVAAMASFGFTSVKAIPRPRLGIITTGSELIALGQIPQHGQIRDSNGPMLATMARELRIECSLQSCTTDSREMIVQALDRLAEVEIVVLAGGVSVGTYDLVPKAVADYGAELVFHGVKQKPGKPLLLARKGRQLLFGLPGNPLGCHFGFHRYVSAAIRKMSGREAIPTVFRGEVVPDSLLGGIGAGDRTHFIPARAAYATHSRASWCIELLPGLTSADVFSTCHANCYVELLPGNTAKIGDVLPFTRFDGVS
jgi:molybdopterin molybdotransferase